MAFWKSLILAAVRPECVLAVIVGTYVFLTKEEGMNSIIYSLTSFAAMATCWFIFGYLFRRSDRKAQIAARKEAVRKFKEENPEIWEKTVKELQLNEEKKVFSGKGKE